MQYISDSISTVVGTETPRSQQNKSALNSFYADSNGKFISTLRKKRRNDSKPVQNQQLQTKDSSPKYTAAREKKKPGVRPGWQKSNSPFNNPVAFLL